MDLDHGSSHARTKLDKTVGTHLLPLILSATTGLLGSQQNHGERNRFKVTKIFLKVTISKLRIYIYIYIYVLVCDFLDISK
jgi:hypothetical protein